MKRLLLIVVTLVSAISFSFSQDVIRKINGDSIQAKVLEVTIAEIKYKKFDNPEGPTFTVAKSEVLKITYQNGTTDTFTQREQGSSTSGNEMSPQQYFRQGQSDAALYYKGYKGSGTATFFVSLISPLAGLVPAIACSSTPPKESNLNFPDQTLRNQLDYYDGYALKAKKVKKAKVWKNWGIAFGINIVAVILLSI